MVNKIFFNKKCWKYKKSERKWWWLVQDWWPQEAITSSCLGRTRQEQTSKCYWAIGRQGATQTLAQQGRSEECGYSCLLSLLTFHPQLVLPLLKHRQKPEGVSLGDVIHGGLPPPKTQQDREGWPAGLEEQRERNLHGAPDALPASRS